MLADYPAETLHEPIAGLHDTPARYKQLCSAAERDVCQRALQVQEELAFADSYAPFYRVLADADLPLRVTHNDTKLNNILFDAISGEPVCVIDLDTVMPGYSLSDFGDSVRAGACRKDDSEKIDLELFSAFTRGFLEGCEGSLTDKEIELLPESVLLITLELGMRFLTDYLLGDTYFKIKYPTHNLDRARNQFALARDMEKKLPQMKEIVNSLR
jgi:Ser/Thr protein kinase RdoA (MazF antagonist)